MAASDPDRRPAHSPRVAIGIPVYNNAKYLREALDSLVAQTFTDFRAVLVDDGTSDGSAAILDEFAAKDSRFELVRHAKNTGLVHAWQVAANAALAHDPEYFAWFGDHDRVGPGWLEALVRGLDRDDEIALGYARPVQIDEAGETLRLSKPHFDTTGLTVWERMEAAAFGHVGAGDVVYGLIRASVLRACGVFRTECFPDRLLVSEATIYGSIKLVADAQRFRRMFAAPEMPIDELFARQLRTLFNDDNQPSKPALSFLTALHRAKATSDEPIGIQLRREQHAWMFLVRNRHKLQSIWTAELEAGGVPEELEPYLELVQLESSAPSAFRDPAKARNDHRQLLATKRRLDRLKRSYRWALGLAFIGPVLYGAARAAKRLLRSKNLNTPLSPARVLHLVPKSIVDSDPFHGSTKDIRNRTEYFQARGIEYDELLCERSDELALDDIAAVDLRQYGAIIVDLPGSFPKTMAQLQARSGPARVFFRSHNAEFFHRMDWVRASRDPADQRLRRTQAYKNLVKDVLCMLEADRVLAIADWDTTRYWRWLGLPWRAQCVPYYFPRYCHEAFPPPTDDTEKEDLCVCIGSGAPGPLTYDQIEGFARAVRAAGDRVEGWTFEVTGGTGEVELPEGIDAVGTVASPVALLRRARAMALLSNLGRGFKTKILDAIEAKTWVIIPHGLYRRLPTEVRPWCLPIDPDSAEDFVAALARTREAWPTSDPSAELRERAFAAMDRALGLRAATVASPASERRIASEP